jgi:hypothetical protein
MQPATVCVGFPFRIATQDRKRMDASDIPDDRETSLRFPTYPHRYLRVCRTQPGERSEHGMMEGMDRRTRPAGKLAGKLAGF